MNIFETELKKGTFVISECLKCNKIVWPPSDYCNHCFRKISWRNSDGIGKIIEYSKKEETFFCLAEFEKKIRVMGRLRIDNNQPEIGKNVKLESCNIDGKNYNFTMVLI